jgi:hypothetical protein
MFLKIIGIWYFFGMDIPLLHGILHISAKSIIFQEVFGLQIAFMIIMFILVLLFYLSNPSNKINQWCTISGFFFWLGVAKQAVLYDIISVIHTAFGTSGLDVRFAPIHSVSTWAIYTLAMPTMVIAGAYFFGLDKTHPKIMSWGKRLVFLPALIITLLFSPLQFQGYQMYSQPFWVTYAAYNFCLGAVISYLVTRGIRLEAPGKSKHQKKQVVIVLLPSLYYWLISVFIKTISTNSRTSPNEILLLQFGRRSSIIAV